ncbi:centrosomal protein of 152 kDa-like [Lineus longissimus]|uniref:centrosomal protein of 152 kDa-like n=1 Tax=Lineus longissimus TaxID=88925 RepID=UPI00315C70BD
MHGKMEPGNSMYFDAQALQDQDEAELLREEEEQQKELQERLAAEFDDLIDDDESDSTDVTSSGEMDSSHNVTGESAVQVEEQKNEKVPDQQTDGWPAQGKGSSQEQELVSPGHQMSPRYQYPDYNMRPQNYYDYQGELHGNYPHGENLENHVEWEQQRSPYGPIGGEYMYDHGKDGHQDYQVAHMAPIHEEYAYQEGYDQPQYMNGPGYYPDGYYPDGYHGYGTSDGHYMSSQESTFSPHHEYQSHPEQFPEYPTDINHNSPHSAPFSPKNYDGSSPRAAHLVNSAKSPKDLENYKVQYVQQTQADGKQETGEIQEADSKESKKAETDRQFIEQGGAPDTRQLAQLQILYSARGRKLDEMTRNYEALKEEAARDTRIMKHKLAKIEGEKEGLSASLNQSQALLHQAQDENSRNRSTISSLTSQLDSLNKTRAEYEKNIEDAESTISDLNQQLIDLTTADCMSRARDRHDTLIHSIKQKHDREMFALKEKMDETTKILEEKKDEVESLRQQLSTVMKSSESSNLDRINAINKLTQSLDESQQRCRELLEKGSPEEVNRLKVQVVQAEASKSISDDLCQALQDELQDLKEQLSMYESAASFGVHPSPAPKSGSRAASPTEGCHSDSFVQLNIKGGVESKIPRLDTSFSGRQTPPPSEGTLKQVKVEFERCLLNYRQKQAQVRKLQDVNMAMKKDLTEARRQYENLNLTLKQETERIEVFQVKVADYEKGQGQKTPLEERLERDVAKLEGEKLELAAEVEALQNRLEDFANNEERLTEMNNELNTELSQVMRNFSDEKMSNQERYHATLQQHYEEAKDRIRDELVQNFNEERRKLIASYQSQVEETRVKLDETVKELLSVKDSYVTVCREKDSIEERIKNDCREAYDKRIEELKEQLVQEKEEELQKLRRSLLETNQVTMATAKDKWWKEKEEDMKREVEAQVAMAKVEWFEEHKSEKQAAVESATKNAEREWKIRLETEVESRLENRMKEAEEMWLDSQKCQVDNLVEKQIKSEKEKLQTKFQNDLKNEEKRWEKEAESRQEVAIQRALSKAKADWLKSRKESESIMRSDVETSLMRKHQSNMEKEIAQALKVAREKWVAEKQAEITELMENNKNLLETELQGKLEERIRELEQEVDKLKRIRDRLEKELQIFKEASEEEKETLIKLKDIEVESLKSRRDKLEQDFTSMKKAWFLEKQELIDGHQTALQKKETELKNFRQLCNRLEIDCKSLSVEKEGLESEYATLKLRREDLEREFRSAKESWLLEKEELIRRADVEKRQAVNAVDDQHEEDRKALVDEHNDMLERALKAAKEQFEKEMAQLMASHEADVERLREHERKSLESFAENDSDKSIIREMESKFSWERNEVERIWQKKLVEAQTRYDKECEELTKHFQENVTQLRDRYEREQKDREMSFNEKLQMAKEEAKKERESLEKGWEKKLEWTREAYEKEKQILHASHREDMKRALEQVKKEKEAENTFLKQEWQTQQSQLLQELARQEQMLQGADHHIEAEIERLRKDLETEHEDRLHKELESLQVRYETEFSRTVDSSTGERQRLQDELEKTSKQLKDLELKYEKVIMSYQEKLNMTSATLEKYEQHKEEMKNSLEMEYNDMIDSCEREKNDFATKLELCQEQLHRVRNEREEIEIVHAKCEKRLAELRDRIRKAERQILDSENQRKQDLEQLKKSMEAHHQVVVEAMKAKVIEVRKHHTVAMEMLKKQHIVEKQELTKRTLQDVTNKISQTENIANVEKSAMEEMRTYYLNTVNKIRDDVMKHVNETNNRAAKTVRMEMSKERQTTAKTLKQHYLQCFRQLLAQNEENLNSDAKLTAMEKALDLAPIKGSSGSRCSTPQPQSAFSPTSNNFTPVPDSNDSRSRNTSKSFNQSNTSKSCHSDSNLSKSSRFNQSDGNVSMKADATTNTENSLDSSVQKYWNSVEKNRNVPRSSEKYPVRNISPSRTANVKQVLMSSRGHSEVSISGVHELCLSQPESLEKFTRDRASPDLDNTQPSRDVNTSGYRSMSYLSRSPESDRSHVLKEGQRSPTSKSLPVAIFNNKYGKIDMAKDVRNNSYKYISLRNSNKGQSSVSTSMNFNSYIGEDMQNSHLFDSNIDLAEVGLNKLPMQPRPYNPPAERLISEDSESKTSSTSTCTTPSCDGSKTGNKLDQDVLQNRQKSDVKKLHYCQNTGDAADLTPRKSLRSSKSKSTEKSGKKTNHASRHQGDTNVKLLKPLAMCTRHTQVPSPPF